MKSACDELGVTLIAYSPIAQGDDPLVADLASFGLLKENNRFSVFFFVPTGALTGKYTPENPPKGPRGKLYTPEFLTTVSPVYCDYTVFNSRENIKCTPCVLMEFCVYTLCLTLDHIPLVCLTLIPLACLRFVSI